MKQKIKDFFKNDKWKIWAVSFVVITGSMAVGIGIGMGIYANSDKAKPNAYQQEISVSVNDSADNLKEAIYN